MNQNDLVMVIEKKKIVRNSEEHDIWRGPKIITWLWAQRTDQAHQESPKTSRKAQGTWITKEIRRVKNSVRESYRAKIRWLRKLRRVNKLIDEWFGQAKFFVSSKSPMDANYKFPHEWHRDTWSCLGESVHLLSKDTCGYTLTSAKMNQAANHRRTGTSKHYQTPRWTGWPFIMEHV